MRECLDERNDALSFLDLDLGVFNGRNLSLDETLELRRNATLETLHDLGEEVLIRFLQLDELAVQRGQNTDTLPENV